MARISAIALAALAACLPAVRAASWKDLGDSFCNAALGLDFSGGKTGYVPCNSQSGGAELMASTNGLNWTTSSVPAVMMLDVAANDPNVVVASAFGSVYSLNGGKTFSKSTEPSATQSQSMEYANGMFFATGNNFAKGNGVSVSTNKGANFTFHDASSVLNTTARYGSFPTADVWYVTAGEWPSSNYNNKAYEVREDAATAEAAYAAGGQYAAQIVKSADGGKTWTTVFPYTTNKFYFNGISCSSATECCAAGEAHAGPNPGAHILCTTDGGANWKSTDYPAGSGMMSIRSVGAGEWWAGGDQNGGALLLHSTDDAKTWVKQPAIPNVAIMELSFADPAHGYAIAVNAFQQSSFLKYE